VKLLIAIGVIGALIIVPFYKLRVRWAVELWSRIKLIAIVYCIVVFAAAVARLIFNFDAIYG
jgi:energy-converting hydrogenase Eha subunit H